MYVELFNKCLSARAAFLLPVVQKQLSSLFSDSKKLRNPWICSPLVPLVWRPHARIIFLFSRFSYPFHLVFKCQSLFFYLASVGFSCLSCSPFADVFASIWPWLISAKSNHIGFNSSHWLENKRMLLQPGPALCSSLSLGGLTYSKPSLSASLFYPCIV